MSQLFSSLNDYHHDLVQVTQARYEEVKIILETYFRQLIALKREELDAKNTEEEGDLEMEAGAFALIADSHNDKLGKLRDGYELFSRIIKDKYDQSLSFLQ